MPVFVANGLPVVGPAETLISLGRHLVAHDLTAAADRLVSGTLKVEPLMSLSELAMHLDAAAGRPGIRRLREAMLDVRVGAWSRPETLLRILVLRAGFPEPTLNPEVQLDDGSVARPDLAWLDLRLAMEYDGGWHGASNRQWLADAERRERFTDSSWRSLQVTAPQLFGANSGLVARIVRRFAECGVRLPHAIDMSRMPRFVP